MSGPPNPDAEGRVITFYSFKGGTGRSMALANIACLLARGSIGGDEDAGERAGARPVLAIDWDLEAPGLHRYLAGFLPDTEGQPGVIEAFMGLDDATRDHSPQGSDHDQQAADAILETLDLDRFVIGTTIPGLSFMPAGRFDEGYPGRVSAFRWDLLHERMPELIPVLARKLAERFSYVLIDSRTGFTDTSGICTMLMPELLVAVFTPNLQSLQGVLDLVRDATEYRRGSADLRSLVVFPLPSRVEPARPQLLQYWRSGSAGEDFTGYQPAFESTFQDVYRLDRCDLTGYFDEVQIQHVPDYAYGEQLAAELEETDSRLSLKRSYESFARRLVGLPNPWTDPRVAAVEAQIRELTERGRAALADGDLHGAQRQLDRAQDLHEENPGAVTPELADGLQDLGRRLMVDGKLVEAETAVRGAVAVAERAFDDDDLTVAAHLERLADLLGAIGRTTDGLEIMDRVLRLRQAALGEQHTTVADSYQKQGVLLGRLGRLSEGVHAFERSLEIRQQLVGPRHPSVATSLQWLGEASLATGDHMQAEHFYTQALEIVPSDDPAARARILNRLGWLHVYGGDLDRAEKSFQQASAVLGSDLSAEEGLVLADSLDGAGQVAIYRNDFELAQGFYERAQLAREEALGPSHPVTLRSVVNLGHLAAAQHEWDRASRHYQRVASSLGKTVGSDHPLMALVSRGLGDVARAKGDYQAAQEAYERSREISERIGDLDDLADSYEALGSLAIVSGDNRRAQDWYKRALHIREQLGERLGVARTSRELGRLALARGALFEANDWYRRALALSEELNDRAGIAESLMGLGEFAQKVVDPEGALERYEQALRISDELGDSARVAVAVSRIGTVLTESGRVDEAVPFSLAAFAVRSQSGESVQTDLTELQRQRELLGDDKFRQLVREAMGEEAVALLASLDKLAEAEG